MIVIPKITSRVLEIFLKVVSVIINSAILNSKILIVSGATICPKSGHIYNFAPIILEYSLILFSNYISKIIMA